MIQIGDKVEGSKGVFFADKAATGVVLALTKTTGETLARVHIDNGEKVFVPLSSLTKIEREPDAVR